MALPPKQKTPAQLGFWMPAEWEPHEATWLAWPHKKSDWPWKFAPIPWVYAEIIRHLSRVEKVHLIVRNRSEEVAAKQILGKAGANLAAVRFFQAPTDRGWMRDSGPIFLRNGQGEIAATHWHFNGWAKYGNWKKDAEVVTRLSRKWKFPVWQPAHSGRRIERSRGKVGEA